MGDFLQAHAGIGLGGVVVGARDIGEGPVGLPVFHGHLRRFDEGAGRPHAFAEVVPGADGIMGKGFVQVSLFFVSLG